MIIIRCDNCRLDYDETAYRHHLANSCDYGIYPMLACDRHGVDCEYNDPVWRFESRQANEAPHRIWRGKKCNPIYMIESGRVHYRSDQEMWGGTYLVLYTPPRLTRQAPRLPLAAARAAHTPTKETP